VVPQLGHGAVAKVLVVGLAYRPDLQLVHRVTGRVEVVVTGELGQFGGMVPAIALMAAGPGQERALGAALAGRIGGQGDAGLGMDLALGIPSVASNRWGGTQCSEWTARPNPKRPKGQATPLFTGAPGGLARGALTPERRIG
jgi:hypothetical protein